jgi:hypothetical protein
MKRPVFVLALFVLAALPAFGGPNAVRVEIKDILTPGDQDVVFNVYATRDGGTPLKSEARRVTVDRNGAIATPLGALPYPVYDAEERWLSVQVNGKESKRVRIDTTRTLPPVVLVISSAAITANGIIESVSQGFKFPDGTIQTSAATQSGGVPSVNGIGGAVTIAGAGTNTVSTVASTITVTGSHGNQAGGTLHSVATTGTAGFMSAADKTKLDAVTAYSRTVIVSATPGNAPASGTALINALANISSPSATNTFLLKLEPGVYDIGVTQLVMRSFVDIEGSGEGVTFINAARGNATNTLSAAVNGASNAELRSLTITNTGNASANSAGFFASSVTTRLSQVTIAASGGTTTTFGLLAGTSAILTLSNVTLTATGTAATATVGLQAGIATTINISNSTITGKGAGGGTGNNTGVLVNSSTAIMTIDSSLIAAAVSGNNNNGISVTNGDVAVTNSTVRADAAGNRAAVSTSGASAILNVFHSRLLCGTCAGAQTQLSASRSNGALRIGASMLDGSTVGTITCAYVYDAAMNELGSCPTAIP